MSLTAPSERNIEIYQRIHFGGESLRMVADLMDISRTRVHEICRQVERWYQRSQPQWAAGLNRHQQAAATWRMHQERLKYLYGETMYSWRKSQQPRMVSKDANNGCLHTVTTNHYGDMRYLKGAILVSREMALATNAMLRLPEECFAPVLPSADDDAIDTNTMDALADAEDAPIPAWDDAETANKFEPSAPTLPPDSAGAPDEALDEAPPVVADEAPVASTTATKTSALSPDEIAKARAELRRMIGSLRAAPEGSFEGLKSPNAKPAPAMSKSQTFRARRRRESRLRRNEQARIGAENRIASNKIANSVS